MHRARSAVVGILTSIALAAVTLAVFDKNQYNGPEGALRQFVMSVMRSDRAGALEATGGVGGPGFERLATEVRFHLRSGGVYEFLEVRRQNGRAFAVVEVRYPNTRHQSLWALVRAGRRWHVDPEGSARLRGWPVTMIG